MPRKFSFAQKGKEAQNMPARLGLLGWVLLGWLVWCGEGGGGSNAKGATPITHSSGTTGTSNSNGATHTTRSSAAAAIHSTGGRTSAKQAWAPEFHKTEVLNPERLRSLGPNKSVGLLGST